MLVSTENIPRYCSIEESISKSMQEIKLMRENKLPKKSWKDYIKEQENDKE